MKEKELFSHNIDIPFHHSPDSFIINQNLFFLGIWRKCCGYLLKAWKWVSELCSAFGSASWWLQNFWPIHLISFNIWSIKILWNQARYGYESHILYNYKTLYKYLITKNCAYLSFSLSKETEEYIFSQCRGHNIASILNNFDYYLLLEDNVKKEKLFKKLSFQSLATLLMWFILINLKSIFSIKSKMVDLHFFYFLLQWQQWYYWQVTTGILLANKNGWLKKKMFGFIW